MKYSKRYIAFTIVLALVFILKFHILGVDNAQVGRFRGGELDTQVWNPMVAKEVNGQTIHAVIDNQTYNNSKSKFYMDKNRNIMVPVSMLRDALNCSAHVYDKKRLLVEKHSQSVSMDVGQKKAYLNGDEVDISSALKEVRGQLVVSLEDLSNLLGYSCSFDIASNTITASDKDTSAIVPASYDLRERDRVSTIYNQGSYGTCWAFAATSALESSLRPEEKVNFSVDHMSMSNSFHANQYDGGEYTMGMAYLAAWQGPVYEKDDPYGDGMTDDSLKVVRHVQEMQVIDGKDYEGIKEAVFKYGGVESSLYSTIRSSQGSSVYYNQNTSAYCYIGTEKPNHDVVIIGWDDNYSRSNFNTPLEGDGAFICQNSWGDGFGENGIFYVSYYDTNIGTHNVAYTRVDDVHNYDHIYQSDLCGWVGKLGYDSDQIYGANVFEAKGSETLSAASFYATGANTQYEVYVVHDFENEKSFAQREQLEDKLNYYNIQLDTVVDTLPGGIAIYEVLDAGLNIVYASKGVSEISGRTQEEFLEGFEQDRASGMVDQDIEMVDSAVYRAIHNGEEINVTYRLRHLNGKIIWVNMQGRIIGEQNGRPLLLGVFRNLSESTQVYESLLDESLAGIFVSAKKDGKNIVYRTHFVFTGTLYRVPAQLTRAVVRTQP